MTLRRSVWATLPASMRAEDGEDGATNGEITAPARSSSSSSSNGSGTSTSSLDDHVVERTAIITRGAGQPLGLDLAEITGQVVIVKVHDGTAAAACRQLVVGDITTAVNTSAFGTSKSDPCQLIRAMPEGFPVTITVVGRPLGVTQAPASPARTLHRCPLALQTGPPLPPRNRGRRHHRRSNSRRHRRSNSRRHRRSNSRLHRRSNSRLHCRSNSRLHRRSNSRRHQ